MQYRFAGSELNQAYWVHRGLADAGAFNDGDWERTPKRIRNDLRIIHRSQPLLRWLVSMRKTLPPDVRETLVSIFLEMHESQAGRDALFSAKRFAKFELLTDQDKKNLKNWRSMLLPPDKP